MNPPKVQIHEPQGPKLQTPKLQTMALRKEYPGTVALDDVTVSFAGGQVHALLGKNGAGKSTLVKILAGSVQPTSGTMLIDGREVQLRSPLDAFKQGIATVYQELSLVPDLSIAENILLGRMPRRRTLGVWRIDWPEAFRSVQALLDDMEAGLDSRRLVGELSVAQQQVVEIAKAMSFAPSVLMLDEPTSALARHETEHLFRLVRKLAAKGVAVLYITHRLQELHQIADTVTVVRDGKLIGVMPFAQATPQSIVMMMFGQVVPKGRPADLVPATDPLLEIRGLTRPGKFHDVSFTLHRGEVLGIAGMLGSGRTELLRAIFGAEPAERGQIFIEGKPVRASSPSAMCAAGVVLTPENRKEEGLVLGLSTRANFFLASLQAMAWHGISSVRRERAAAAGWIRQLAVKVADIEAPIDSLSGGNQQKVVIGKWLNAGPRVILFDEPTRGIDILAKQQIFEVMWDLSRRGLGCVFVSSELEELVEVCHRILILKDGRISDEVLPENVTPDELTVRCMVA